MRRLFILLIALSLLAPTALAAGTIPLPVLTVLPLGDSITLGARVNGGYRLPLQEMLAADGIPFNFVGTEAYNSEGMADPDHAGWGSYRIDQVQARLDTIAETPNVVLLHIGTNDLYQRYELDRINARLTNLVAALHTKWPAARIIVATVGPYAGTYFDGIPTMNSNAIAYNAHIVSLPGVIVARMSLPPELLGDGIHPNAAGYVAMAEVWHQAIMQPWMAWLPIINTKE